MFVHSFDFVDSGMLTGTVWYGQLGIVININNFNDTTRDDFFLKVEPSACWRGFSFNVDVIFDGLTSPNYDWLQVGSVNSWFYWKKIKCRLKILGRVYNVIDYGITSLQKCLRKTLESFVLVYKMPNRSRDRIIVSFKIHIILVIERYVTEHGKTSTKCLTKPNEKKV